MITSTAVVSLSQPFACVVRCASQVNFLTSPEVTADLCAMLSSGARAHPNSFPARTLMPFQQLKACRHIGMEGFPTQEMRNAHVTAATHHEVKAHHSATSASSHCHCQAEVLPVKALTSQDMPAQPVWLAALTSISVSQLAPLHATTSCLPGKALMSCRSDS